MLDFTLISPDLAGDILVDGGLGDILYSTYSISFML